MEYIEEIREASPREGLIHLDADTAMSPGSFEAALRAAGGATFAVDEVFAKRTKNAFVATRPPGHYAETARAMVCRWGMSTKLGPLSFGSTQGEVFLGRDFSSRPDYSEKPARASASLS